MSQVCDGDLTASGLLAAPLAGHGPPEQLLHVPRHVHRVLQVEVSVCVQHGVVPGRRTRLTGSPENNNEMKVEECSHGGVNAEAVGVAHRGRGALVHERRGSSAGFRVRGGKSDKHTAHITSLLPQIQLDILLYYFT